MSVDAVGRHRFFFFVGAFSGLFTVDTRTSRDAARCCVYRSIAESRVLYAFVVFCDASGSVGMECSGGCLHQCDVGLVWCTCASGGAVSSTSPSGFVGRRFTLSIPRRARALVVVIRIRGWMRLGGVQPSRFLECVKLAWGTRGSLRCGGWPHGVELRRFVESCRAASSQGCFSFIFHPWGRLREWVRVVHRFFLSLSRSLGRAGVRGVGRGEGKGKEGREGRAMRC